MNYVRVIIVVVVRWEGRGTGNLLPCRYLELVLERGEETNGNATRFDS